MMSPEENNNHANMASEPSAALYYGSSTEKAESSLNYPILTKRIRFGLSVSYKGN